MVSVVVFPCICSGNTTLNIEFIVIYYLVLQIAHIFILIFLMFLMVLHQVKMLMFFHVQTFKLGYFGK